jgi:hypothetical protein
VVAAPAGPPPVPVVHPVRHLHDADLPHHGPTSALIGLALLPLGVPILWVAARLLTGVEPVFSFALPVAVALGVAGMCLGVAFTEDWTYPTKVKGVLMLVLLGYAAAAFLYFVQKDWLEAARKRISRDVRWQEFKSDDGVFQVQLPGKARPAPAAEPVPDWKLRVFECADPKQRSTDVYVVAYGPPPDGVVNLDDDAFFTAAKAAISRAAGGVEPTERAITQQGHPGREFALALADNVTNRTVRVVRAGKRAFYLAAEGVALPADAPDVKKFFDSFYLHRGK